jgi:hypothetical protein
MGREEAHQKELREFWAKVPAPDDKPVKYHLGMQKLEVGTPFNHTTSMDDFAKVVNSNVKRIHHKGGTRFAFCFKWTCGVHSSIVVNRHTLTTKDGELRLGEEFEFSESANPVSMREAIVLTRGLVLFEDVARDVVVLSAGHSLLGSGLQRFFWNKCVEFSAIELRRADGKVGVAHFDGMLTPLITDRDNVIVQDVPLIGVYDVGGAAGECGLPYFGRFGGHIALVGMHVASMDGVAVVMPLDRIGLGSVAAQAGMALSPCARLRIDRVPLTPAIHHRAPFGQLPGNAAFIGSVPLGATRKSKVVRTAAYPLVEGGEAFAPPYMGDGYTNEQGVFVSPALNKFSHMDIVSAAPVELVDKAIDDYVGGFAQPEPRRPLPFDLAVEGVEGHAAYTGINFATSAGQPYSSMGAPNK